MTEYGQTLILTGPQKEILIQAKYKRVVKEDVAEYHGTKYSDTYRCCEFEGFLDTRACKCEILAICASTIIFIFKALMFR